MCSRAGGAWTDPRIWVDADNMWWMNGIGRRCEIRERGTLAGSLFVLALNELPIVMMIADGSMFTAVVGVAVAAGAAAGRAVAAVAADATGSAVAAGTGTGAAAAGVLFFVGYRRND